MSEQQSDDEMNMNIPDEEETQLCQRFLQQQDIDPPSKTMAHQAIEQTVRQANAGIGTRDLMVLAGSSFFVFLQILMAPFVARMASRTAAKKPSAQNTDKTQHAEHSTHDQSRT